MRPSSATSTVRRTAMACKALSALTAWVMTLTACATKPAPRAAAGEDRGLFPKAALLGRPLPAVAREPRLLPGLLRPLGALPPGLAPLVAGLAVDAVAFDIGESVLTVVAARRGETLEPVSRFTIAGHFDLAPRRGDDSPAPDLYRDQTAHARWQDRGFIEVRSTTTAE